MNAAKPKQAAKPQQVNKSQQEDSLIDSAIKTVALSIVGTVSLVAIHHLYRKSNAYQGLNVNIGLNIGLNIGFNKGTNTGINLGVNRGKNKGINIGVNNGDNRGLNIGLNAGSNTDINTHKKKQSGQQQKSSSQEETQLSDHNTGAKSKFFNQNSVIKRSNANHSTKASDILSIKNNQQTTASNRFDSNNVNNNANNNANRNKTTHWISGVADITSSEFGVVGIDEHRGTVWQTPIPERVHDILIQPHADTINSTTTQHVVVMGRRPSEHFWVLDAKTGSVVYKIKADDHRHFYGHACYSLEGSLLYVTENDTATFAGILGIYDVKLSYKKIDEFATQGIGPHELVMHPDGETLVIANGGIKTEKASRDELNIDSMQPSLVYVNRHTGQLLEQIYPKYNQMSVRHLSIHSDGLVAIGIQFQGERHLNIPLVLTHRRGDAHFTAMQLRKHDNKGWHRFHQYIASVVIDSQTNLLCATSPIGGCAAIFDLQTGLMLDAIERADCAGATLWTGDDIVNEDADKVDRTGNNKIDKDNHPKFLVSDGQGFLTKLSIVKNKIDADKKQQPFAFDNHLKIVI